LDVFRGPAVRLILEGHGNCLSPYRAFPPRTRAALTGGLIFFAKRPAVGARPCNKKPRTTTVSDAKLDAFIEEATVDAYNESEQMMGLYTMLDEHLDVPFETEVLGVEVTVVKVDLTDDDQIVAVCRRGKSRQSIPILDLPLPSPPPRGAEWIDAYRRWARGE
jgi:hypothetical protein